MIIGGLGGQVGAASKIARDKGAKVQHSETVADALKALRSGNGADLVMVDVKLNVKELIDSLIAERISVPVVGCGFDATSEEAVAAIRAGAKEYIPLPLNEELIAAVLEAISEESHPLLFKSEAMKQVVALAEQISPSDASVLITGESGTGKEVIAHYIHKKSRRADHNFISINCAAIPENLLESELFGHEKGAFTGAVERRIGKFEEAHKGTLLLDEISEMDVRLQAKLLRAIQEKTIDRIGGKDPVKVDIRILATSNRNMEEEVKQGKFRQDLYYRLNVITLNLPPLRRRVDDITILVEHFVDKFSTMNGISKRPLSAKALAKLLDHPWPGNVRELENTMHRAVLLATGSEIGSEAIILSGGDVFASGTTDTTKEGNGNIGSVATKVTNQDANLVGRTLESVEQDLILNTLDHCLGNRTHAANILGISIRTLRNKLKEYSESGISIAGGAD
jgi:DNA-binding NtrC family response regulator